MRYLIIILCLFPVLFAGDCGGGSPSSPFTGINLEFSCEVSGIRADQVTCTPSGAIFEDVEHAWDATSQTRQFTRNGGSAFFDYRRVCNTASNSAGTEIDVSHTVITSDGDIHGPEREVFTICVPGLLQ